MKKLILSILLAVLGMAAHAQATSPVSVAGECARQMQAGICSVRPDPSSVKPGDTMLLSGVGRVQMSAYMDYMSLFNEENPADTAMCGLALSKMTTEPGGDHDKLARALWKPGSTPESVLEYEARKTSERAAIEMTVGAAFAAAAILPFVLTLRTRRRRSFSLLQEST